MNHQQPPFTGFRLYFLNTVYGDLIEFLMSYGLIFKAVFTNPFYILQGDA